jgi:anti-sigma B factor antagonist
MDEDLQLEAIVEGGRATLRASGVLDLSTAGEFRAAARELWPGADELVVDLRRLTFVDSSGLGALLEVRHAAASDHTRLIVLAKEGPVRSAFELTGLSELLEV